MTTVTYDARKAETVGASVHAELIVLARQAALGMATDLCLLYTS